MTWNALAEALHRSPHQLTGLRTARFATGMVLVMRCTGWLQRPAASFVAASHW